MTGDITLGKEYIFVPRPEIEKRWGHMHGRTVIADMHDPIDDTYIVQLDGGPLMVYSDELVDPEVS
jgi:hypothetical protein